MNSDELVFEPMLTLPSVAAAVLLIMVAGFVAQFPGLRRLDHLELASKVRERAF